MTGTIFVEQLKRSWRDTLFWGLGIAMLMFYVLAIIQDVDVLKQYEQLLASMPPALLSAFGLDDAASLSTPEGFLAFGGMTYGILLLAVYAILSGLNITANDEDEGILDVVLALPIARWRVIVEKFLAYVLMVSVIVLIGYGGIIGGRIVVPAEVELDMSRLLVGTLVMIPTTLAMLAVTMMIASLISRKRIAMALSTTFVVASYFIFTIGNAASNAITDFLARLSLFSYFDAEQTVTNGLQVGNIVILLAIIVVSLGISVVAFERRDINV
jgi:ABC-2 type transport system permease protein